MYAVSSNFQGAQPVQGNFTTAVAQAPRQIQGPASFDPCHAQQVSAGGLQGAQQLGQQFNGIVNGQPSVAVVDDFSSGSGHGQRIAGTIQQGSGAGVAGFDINNNGGVSRALDQVIAAAQNGQHFDAVNLSQQNFQASQETAAVQQRIQVLQSMGIPVVVAAGNAGPNNTNQYAQGAAFVAAANTADSGRGNVVGAGPTTSDAAANVTAALVRSKFGR
ncbi:MAG: hypothetical protein KF760_06295 [Candidatus Eremiobacteraeota bacterium]|nr:hypothetical protein [Candidatus Eremiobacteraeota bacterium]MCW5866133.1 hypothetical protein [Candidatus Eremiobacteraeota bacterium]